jgi:hypothetical protein
MNIKSELGHVLDATIPPQEHMSSNKNEFYFHHLIHNGHKLIIVREQPIKDDFLKLIRPYLQKQFPTRDF